MLLNHIKRRSIISILLTSSLSIVGCSSDSNSDIDTITSKKAKNIILMISDGASDGVWDISSYWSYGESLNNTAPYKDFSTRLAVSTFALSQQKSKVNCSDTKVQTGSYDAEQAWNETSIEEIEVQNTPYDPEPRVYNRPFAGYSYLNKNYTDSAAAGSAIATGEKTYLGAIGVDYCGSTVENIVEIAKKNGRATGVITSVPYNHATPATFAAHNQSRKNYTEIGHEMLTSGMLDLIMGAGHPHYNDDNEWQENGRYTYIAKDDFIALQNDTLIANKQASPWKLIENKEDFEKLANNNISQSNYPLFGLAKVGSTLQTYRHCSQSSTIAFECAYNKEVPTLTTMTKGALNYLGQNKDGLFLMIEGGAVDWAAHANNTTGLIEEQVDFNNAVLAVVDWVNKNSSWDETLLIVTTDHGNSYVLGEASDQVAYAKVENPGKGVMPNVKYYSGNHTNELVRIYARGAGEDLFKQHIIANDNNYAEKYNHLGSNGDYIDNTHIFNVMSAAIK